MTENTEQDKKLNDFFKSAVSWDTQQRIQDQQKVVLYKRVAIGAVVFAALMGTCVTALIHMKTIVPAVIRVDNGSGRYDVRVAGENLNVGDSKNEKILISDVTRYIKAREGFTRAEAEENYKQVYLMSCGVQRSEWDNYFNPQLNPKSPVAVLTNQDADRVNVDSVTFIKSHEEGIKVAQVQYTKTVIRGSSSPIKMRYVATMSAKYDERNIPGSNQNYYLNPFGFCITDYRKDPIGNPETLFSRGAPRQEFNAEQERERQQLNEAIEAMKSAAPVTGPAPAAPAAPAVPGAQNVDISNIGVSAAPAPQN